MKIQSLKNLFLIALMAFVITSCKDDDKDSGPANYMTLDGQTLEIKTVVYRHADGNPQTTENGSTYYLQRILLLSDGFTFDRTAKDDISGKGDYTFIEFVSPTSTTSLNVGNYTYTGTSNNPAPLNITQAYYIDNADIATNTDGTELPFTALTITVSASGNTYTIDMTGTVNGKAFKAHFTGKVEETVLG